MGDKEEKQKQNEWMIWKKPHSRNQEFMKIHSSDIREMIKTIEIITFFLIEELLFENRQKIMLTL